MLQELGFLMPEIQEISDLPTENIDQMDETAQVRTKAQQLAWRLGIALNFAEASMCAKQPIVRALHA